jgi:PAS domain S-box-containing protein
MPLSRNYKRFLFSPLETGASANNEPATTKSSSKKKTPGQTNGGTKEMIEAAMFSKEKLLERITDVTPTLLAHCSADLRYLFVNKAAADFLGFPPGKIIGKPVREVLGTAAFETIYPYIKRVLQGERVEYETEIPYVVAGRRFVQVVYVPEFSETNEVIGWFATITDITERKRRERHQTLLIEISDELVTLEKVDTVMQLLGKKIAKHFGVTWCVFSELIEGLETAVCCYGWNDETAASLNGTYRMQDFLTDKQLAKHNAGELSVVSNTQTDISVNAESYGALGIKSFIIVPLSRNGQWQFLLSIIHNAPRVWRDDEIELIREISTRIWIRLERARTEEALRTNEEQMRGQKEALQSAINGAALEESLNILAGIVTKQTAGEARCAFYIADEDATCLHPVFGAGTMPASYLEKVDGFHIGKDSLACGLAFPTGHPVISRDVFEEPLWKPWIYLAEKYNFRGCWSFPISTGDNKTIGTFAMYFQTGREAAPNDLTLADMITQTAAIIISTYIDATERKLIQDALRKSEIRFRTLADAVPDIIWAGSQHGKAIYFNRRWFDYSGRSYQESSGLGWQVIVHPDDAKDVIAKWKQALEKGKIFDTEYRLRRYDGEYRWHIGRVVPLKDQLNKITGWFGSATDIDDLKKAQEALAQSEARLKITMESAMEYAIITTNEQGIVERWSSGAEKAFGYSEAEMKGKPADIIFTPEEKANNIPEKEMQTARKEGRANDDRWHVRKNGSRLFMSGVMAPIYDGVFTGYVKVARDITERKLLEQQKDEFIGIASHELKTPVTTIKAYTELLKEVLDEKQNYEDAQLVTKLDAQVDRLTELIHSLLDTTRISEGQFTLNMEEFDINTLIRERVEEMQHTTEKHRIAFNSTGAIKIKGDRERIEQIFINIISNAIKYSPKGGEVTIVSKRKKDCVQVSVQDNGVGIPPEVKDKIFDRFYRVQNAQIDTFPGMGLGLYISAAIINKHGGTIWVESEQGKGSTFYFRLPYEKE